MLILVSVLCSAAVLIVGDNYGPGQLNRGFRRHIPVTISILIAALWAIFLSERSRPFGSFGLAIVGIVPVLIPAIWRSSGLGPREKVGEGREQFADISHPIETANEETRTQAGESDSEAEPTVPFSQTQISILDEFSEESEPDSTDFSQPDDVTHWLKRSKIVDGEIIEGGVRVEFADGQRDVTVHISFCPPFANVPKIETEDLDGNGLEIRVAAAFPFGARLTVRRPAVSKSEHALDSSRSGRIGFVVIASNIRRVA